MSKVHFCILFKNVESQLWVGCLHKITLFIVQGTPKKRRHKECNSQRGWRTLGKEGPLNQRECSSYELTETDTANTACYGLDQVSWVHIIALVLFFYGTPECRNEWFSDSCAFSWALFLVFVFFCPTFMWWFLFHLIIFCFVMFGCYLFKACSFLMRDRRGVDLDKRACREELGGVVEGDTVIGV